MLRSMRSNLKSLSWVLWLVIFTFVGFVFVEWGTGGMSLKGSKNAVIMVGNHSLSAEAFQKKLSQTIEGYRRQLKQNFNKSMVQQLRLPEQILQQTINSIIVKDEAEKLKIHSKDAELRERITTSPNFQRDGKFIGVRAYENLLAYNRIDVKEFEKDLRQEIVHDKFRELITAGLVIPPKRLETLYHQEMDSAEIDVVRLSPDRIKREIPAVEGDLLAYYNANKPKFKSVERRSGSVVAYPFASYADRVTVTDREEFDYYKQNKEMFRVPAQTRVSRILLNYEKSGRADVLKQAEALAQELTPENFGDTAKARSQDDKAAEGGDWGLYRWKQFTEQEQRIINRLDASGISTPVDTGSAFSVLMVTLKSPETIKTFDEAKKRITAVLQNQKVNDLVQKELETVYNQVKNGKNLAEVCKAMGIDCIQTKPLANGDTTEGIEDMGTISRKFFSMEEGGMEFPVEYGKGLAIIQLNAITAPEIQPFAVVRDKVKAEYIHARRLRLLADEAEALVKELNAAPDEKTIQRILEQRKLEKESVTYKRGNRLAGLALKRGLDEMIFALKPARFADPIPYENAIMVIRPKTIAMMNKDDFQNSRKAFYNRKIEELKSRILATYIYQKRDSYDIRMNQELFEKAKNAAMSRLN